MRLDVDYAGCAEARGLFSPLIVVGERFVMLTEGEQQAVLYHEAHHVRANHRLVRLLVLPFVAVAGLFLVIPGLIAAWQETAADKFAVAAGFGAELKAFLVRASESTPIFYPTRDERIEAIDKLLREASHVRETE